MCCEYVCLVLPFNLFYSIPCRTRANMLTIILWESQFPSRGVAWMNGLLVVHRLILQGHTPGVLVTGGFGQRRGVDRDPPAK